MEQERHLLDEGDAATQLACAQAAEIVAIETNGTAVGIEQPQQEIGDLDLPLPLGPTTAKTSPAATRKDTSSSTGAPRSKEKVTPSNSTSPRTAAR